MVSGDYGVDLLVAQALAALRVAVVADVITSPASSKDGTC
jgi:hypothetical protein